MSSKRKKKLTDGQKTCLRLVASHHTSKEIARKLGISPFTVDQRLDSARQKLGAETRKEAAMIFAAMEAGNLPERLVYEPDAIAAEGHAATLAIPTSDRRYPVGRGSVSEDTASDSNGSGRSFFRSLFSIIRVPPIGGGRHQNNGVQIALQAVNIAFYAALMVGIITIILTVAMNAFR